MIVKFIVQEMLNWLETWDVEDIRFNTFYSHICEKLADYKFFYSTTLTFSIRNSNYRRLINVSCYNAPFKKGFLPLITPKSSFYSRRYTQVNIYAP